MIRYYSIAFVLKMFSFSSYTKKLYRFLGNTIGARNRLDKGLPEDYILRAQWFLNIFEKYNVMQEKARFLELGTGWVHWESMVLRLFYDANFTMLDVWDNRQLKPFKLYLSEFRKVLEDKIKISPSKREHVRKLLDAAISVESFDELYDLMGFEYVVEPNGSLRNLKKEAFDVCFSSNVFEHIHREIISGYLKDLFRLLKPGGYSFHKIDISDHLSKYIPGASKKNYLKYSDAVWKRFFENKVQYFNRIQRNEWLELFSHAGFELVEEEPLLEQLPRGIYKKCKNLAKKDIECVMLRLVHRKPL